MSINFVSYLIDLPLSSSFLTGIEKVIYFSVFSPEHSNWPANYFAKFFIIKCWSYVEQLWKAMGNSFSVSQIS